MLVAPSILSANFNHLLTEVQSVSSAQYLHVDVMDGHFVPNISLGAGIYRHLKPLVSMIFDVHLMISDPMKYAKDFVHAGADIITFHYEAIDDVDSMIDYLRSLQVKVGISIKPNTDINVLAPYLSKVDLILVMSVEPGFGGQTFMMSALDKIKFLYTKRLEHQYSYLIEVDGGINHETAKRAANAGCDILVAGTYIFNSSNREKTIEELKNL